MIYAVPPPSCVGFQEDELAWEAGAGLCLIFLLTSAGACTLCTSSQVFNSALSTCPSDTALKGDHGGCSAGACSHCLLVMANSWNKSTVIVAAACGPALPVRRKGGEAEGGG